MKLKAVVSEERETKVEFLQGTLNVTYRPGAMTPETEDRLVDAAEQPGMGKFMTELFCEVVVKWDLEDDVDDGKGKTKSVVVPLTVEGLRKVPIKLLSDVMNAIREDMSPGEDKSG